MPETKQLLRDTRDRIAPPPDVLGGLERRRRHKENVKRAAAAAVAIVVALIGLGSWFALERDAAPTPADPSEELGIFAPVAGMIVYYKDSGLWAVDPNAPSPASTLVRLSPGGTTDADQFASFTLPLGWSSDGTRLLFLREDPADDTFPYDRYLYILYADGTETQVVPKPVEGAAISPDGSRVAFATNALYVVDAEGGRPVRIAPEGNSPTFSPDGTQIAYLSLPRDGCCVKAGREHVWVANADGTGAHEILANEPVLATGVFELRWSPAGDRIAMWTGLEGHVAIYTFAPDGSGFTKVIDGGMNAFWSPDGSQIAYMLPYGEPRAAGRPLVIADADGANIQVFDFGGVGPWHPAGPVEVNEPSPPASDGFARANGEVLSFGGVVTFAGTPWDGTGDLGAVNPETGEERVLIPDLDKVVSAEWSADGRWVAYERHDGSDIELWVVGASKEPRLIATGGYLFANGSMGWAWSATGADLLWARRTGGSNLIERSKLHLVDVETGETVGLGSVDGDVGLDPAWSPDGTRIALATGNGSVYSVDLGSGERSLLMRLPDMDLDPSPSIHWSPDGTRVSVVNDLGDAGERLYVMDADGSNGRQLAVSKDLLLVSWSPDGTRLAFTDGSQAEGKAPIFVAPMDDSDLVYVGRVPFAGCTYNYMCGLTWSPDGSMIGFHKDEGEDSAIAADGSGEPEPIDDLTYMSWAGGRYGEG